MPAECLPFSRIPHTTPLFEAFLNGSPKLQDFYARPPLDPTWLPAQAAALSFDGERRLRVAAALERQNRAFAASSTTLANIERLRNGAAVVVTGQQVGLFGGPLFALLKAITAVRLADECAGGGHDCVPVFWLATDDHDLAEIQSVAIPGDGAQQMLTAVSEGPAQSPVAAHRLTAQVDELVDAAAQLLGPSTVTDTIREAYRPGVLFGTAFGRLFARIFADAGVILLDAADAELHQIAAPVLGAAVRQSSAINAALRERGAELDRRGFHEQVKVAENSTLLFALRQGARTPVHRDGDGFTIGDERIAESELLARIEARPDDFSPNVLLRPVVEDFLLPTVAYVGGPSEVAYFAQAAVVYQRLLGRVTPIWPRASLTLIEPHAARLLDRYQMSLVDVLCDPDQLRARLAARVLPGDLKQSFDAALDSLAQSMRQVAAALGKLDPTLVDAAQKAEAKMQYQITTLQTRAASAELRRNEIVARHAAQLSSTLFPHHGLQERVTPGVYFLARYPELVQTLRASISLTCPGHQVVRL